MKACVHYLPKHIIYSDFWTNMDVSWCRYLSLEQPLPFKLQEHDYSIIQFLDLFLTCFL